MKAMFFIVLSVYISAKSTNLPMMNMLRSCIQIPMSVISTEGCATMVGAIIRSAASSVCAPPAISSTKSRRLVKVNYRCTEELRVRQNSDRPKQFDRHCKTATVIDGETQGRRCISDLAVVLDCHCFTST